MKAMRGSLACMLVLLSSWPALAGDPAAKPPRAGDRAAAPAQTEPHPPGTVVLQLIDGGSLKVIALDERVSMETPYGRLGIPISEIVEIRFGLRIEAEEGTRIAEAVQALSADDFTRREKASVELVKLKERAVPALMKLAKSEDLEIAKRAQRVLDELRTRQSREELEIPEHDEVTTVHSRIAGWISNTSLKVRTFQFGEQALKLSDVRGLKTVIAAEPETTEADPDPGNLTGFQGQIGKTLAFKVTGPAAGTGGSVWGTDFYTLDSNLALACVHAGILKPGQTGVVRVLILPPQGAFQGSQRNGITTSAFANYPGAYRFVLPTRKVPRIERPAPEAR